MPDVSINTFPKKLKPDDNMVSGGRREFARSTSQVPRVKFRVNAFFPSFLSLFQYPLPIIVIVQQNVANVRKKRQQKQTIVKTFI